MNTAPVETVMDTKYCFYVSGSHSIYDFAILRQNGERMGAYGNKTLTELQAENPNIKLVLFDDAVKEINELDQKRYSNVREISEDRYNEMLNILPPMDWKNGSFLLCEATSGTWHQCFLEHGGKYYEGYSNRRKEDSITRRERFLSTVSR